MWKVLSVTYICFTVAFADHNESFSVPNIVDVLQRSEPFDGVGSQCQEHLGEYLEGINKFKGWAIQMTDSITKFPDGVLFGHISIPGHFDECVQVIAPNFTGKHCMVNLQIFGGQPNYHQPKVIHKGGKRDNQPAFQFNYGFCVPSTCNASELNTVFEESISPNITTVIFTDRDCSTSDARPFRTEDWITVGIIVFISITALASSGYEIYVRMKMKKDNPSPLWSAFSIISNGKQLFRISQSSAQLKSLHGIRFLSMCWVILGHSYITYAMGITAMNMRDLPKFFTDKSFVPVSNAFVSVDSFFFLSGLLVCVVFFRDISKKGTFDVPVAFIHRYIRLTPPFALLMLIQSTVVSRLGNGPFWNVYSESAEEACRESWWAGLLYVQNYVKPEAVCLGQAWYLSADMQMFWVSPLILYPILFFPAFAPFFILVLILAATFTSFGISFVNKFSPNLFSTTIGSPDGPKMDQFKLEYIPFHTRMAPWLIGLATGYIICGLQAKKIKLNLSKFWILVGWMAALALLGGSLFGINRFISAEFTQVESSFYLSFHRVGWALGMAWVVIACVGGYGGLINDFLSLDIFQPLAKLSYCNFLIHMTLQSFRLNTTRVNPYLRHFDAVYGYFGDLVLSNLISIPLVLFFEMPFTNLDRHFLQKLSIFPFPKPKIKKEKDLDVKVEKIEEPEKKVEEGKINPAYSES